MPPDTEERLRFLIEMGRRGQELLANNPAEPEDWSDAAKLRLQALYLDKYDLDRGAYDRHTVQDDLRRIADRIEELGDAW